MREADAKNWALGRYVMVAFNAPKEYPEAPLLSKKTGLQTQTPEEMDRVLAANAKKMGWIINKPKPKQLNNGTKD